MAILATDLKSLAADYAANSLMPIAPESRRLTGSQKPRTLSPTLRSSADEWQAEPPSEPNSYSPSCGLRRIPRLYRLAAVRCCWRTSALPDSRSVLWPSARPWRGRGPGLSRLPGRAGPRDPSNPSRSGRWYLLRLRWPYAAPSLHRPRSSSPSTTASEQTASSPGPHPILWDRTAYSVAGSALRSRSSFHQYRHA